MIPTVTAPALPLSLDTVVKDFGKTRAVDGISLSVGPGEIVAMVGPSGCGKSTTLRMVAGLERPDSGRVSLAGCPPRSAASVSFSRTTRCSRI